MCICSAFRDRLGRQGHTFDMSNNSDLSVPLPLFYGMTTVTKLQATWVAVLLCGKKKIPSGGENSKYMNVVGPHRSLYTHKRQAGFVCTCWSRG
mmetsp:Transcript_63037/g.104912  ORF Transcript_63037/g.104912 Transcript_63037/m.104912 type:complete len:94 (-) Transcript_63037:410-691(-)